MFAHGWFGWAEGSVVIRAKNSPPYVATRGGSTATLFYVYTLGFMAVGSLASLGALFLTWSVWFGSQSRKGTIIRILSQPMKGRYHAAAIPSWLFWGAISAFVSALIYAAAQ